MVYFKVMDMYSCRSMGAITKSVKAIDHDATVRIDMVEHRVEISSEKARSEDLQRAIDAAGFTPIPLGAHGSHRGIKVDVLLPLD